ncbi:hypothetical protein ABZ619_39000 [Streptomyces sp. NPDC007851]|uniref:hypothetical protein n=1 Tax=Streptomyces sp. NPDC007851 TaxID=3155008 RepID=UPI00340A059E
MSSKVYERTEDGTTTHVSIREGLAEVNHAMMDGKSDVRRMSSGHGQHSIDYKDGRTVRLVEVEAPAATVEEPALDWAALAVTTTLLATSGRAVAEEMVAEYDHMVLVSREPGGEWQPVTDPEQTTRYTYLFHGELRAGTLADYAQDWKTALPGMGHVTPHVRTWNGATFTVGIDRLGVIKGWMTYRLTVGAETVDVTFDGRD